MGAPAWGNKSFVGKIYPTSAKLTDYLVYYSQQFDAIELNTTFYRLPSTDTISGWIDKTPDRFRFCPKFPQSISNSRNLNARGEITDRFFEMIKNFGEKFGVAFLQLPQHFSVNRLDELSQYLSQLPTDLSISIEFRHPSWFDTTGLISEAAKMLDNLDKGAVITDTSGRRDVLHLTISSNVLVIRFAGNRLHQSDFQRLDRWIQQIVRWKDTSIDTVYFFMHQPEEHLTVDLAIYVASKLKEHSGIEISCPKTISEQG